MKIFILIVILLSAHSLIAEQVPVPDYLKLQQYTYMASTDSWRLNRIFDTEFAGTHPVSLVEYSVDSMNNTVPVTKQTYLHDFLNHLTGYTRSSYNSSPGTWKLAAEASYSYLNDNVIEETAHYDSVYIKQSAIIDDESGKSRLSYKLQLNNQKGTWDTLNKYVNIFDDKKRVVQTESYSYDNSARCFNQFSEERIIYNNDNSLAEKLKYAVYNGIKESAFRTLYEYKYFDNLLSKMDVFKADGSSWELSYTISYKYYYPNGKLKASSSVIFLEPDSIYQTDNTFYVYGENKKTIYDTLTTLGSPVLTKSEYEYPIKTSVTEFYQTRLIGIYPNPAGSGDDITLTLPEAFSSDFTVRISNYQGESLFQKSLSNLNDKILIQSPNLPSGIYFIELRGKKGFWGITKLIIGN